MVHAGIGEGRINMILAALDIRNIHNTTLKSRKREDGKAIENVAHDCYL